MIQNLRNKIEQSKKLTVMIEEEDLDLDYEESGRALADERYRDQLEKQIKDLENSE